jgi:hypothetical protein
LNNDWSFEEMKELANEIKKQIPADWISIYYEVFMAKRYMRKEPGLEISEVHFGPLEMVQ